MRGLMSRTSYFSLQKQRIGRRAQLELVAVQGRRYKRHMPSNPTTHFHAPLTFTCGNGRTATPAKLSASGHAPDVCRKGLDERGCSPARAEHHQARLEGVLCALIQAGVHLYVNRAGGNANGAKKASEGTRKASLLPWLSPPAYSTPKMDE